MKLLALGFQDPASPIMEGIIDLHNHIMFYLVLILVFVLYMFFSILRDFYQPYTNPETLDDLKLRQILLKGNAVVHGTLLEIIWTLTPSFILMLIAVPSFSLLYSMDEIIDPSLTLKAVGHQWYWSYEYSDYIQTKGSTLNFDSYMLPTEELKLGQTRLLEVDNATVLPVKTHIRVIVTATDVLHSWAVPALGVKIDAVPGRLNQVQLFIKREGVYYGQCSEICGVNHGFMPIAIKGVSMSKYLNWLNAKF
jgi:cytochrome c oxidase subunit 2